MTRRQREVLEFIRARYSETGASPTFAEIAEHIGVTALATVHEHVQALVHAGHLRRTHANQANNLVPVRFSCPHCGGELNAMAAPAVGDGESPWARDAVAMSKKRERIERAGGRFP